MAAILTTTKIFQLARSNIRYYLKFLLNLSSIFLIVFGVVQHTENLVVVGSVIFLVSLLITTLSVIKLSRSFKNKTSSDIETSEDESSINNLLEGLIILYGLVALVISEPSYFEYSGQIIWFSAILFYVLNGIIASWITNIPLKMTNGGWRVKYKKRYKRR